MSPVQYALQHASRGWPVFPVQPLGAGDRAKSPFPGFTEWEQKATTNAEVIATWWGLDYPEALPAVCPGRVSRICIDVDRHPGKPDGYRSLVDAQVHIPDSVPRFTSVSGNGWHYWFRGDSTSRNALYPGVDRKARGGYVVVMYDLPAVRDITTRLTTRLHGAEPADELHPYDGKVSEWLLAHERMSPSSSVLWALRRIDGGEAFTGHPAMLKAQTHLVKLAREGHGGVPEALEALHQRWLESPHVSGDPETTWEAALKGAIEKWGGSS